MHNGFFIVAPMFFFVIGAIQIRDDDDDDDETDQCTRARRTWCEVVVARMW